MYNIISCVSFVCLIYICLLGRLSTYLSFRLSVCLSVCMAAIVLCPLSYRYLSVSVDIFFVRRFIFALHCLSGHLSHTLLFSYVFLNLILQSTDRTENTDRTERTDRTDKTDRMIGRIRWIERKGLIGRIRRIGRIERKGLIKRIRQIGQL